VKAEPIDRFADVELNSGTMHDYALVRTIPSTPKHAFMESSRLSRILFIDPF
jgi:hypothetical protein